MADGSSGVTSTPCPGCGVLFPPSEGPIHPYIGTSVGCWAAYGDVLAKEYGAFRYVPVHRRTVDAYAVQHPGVPSRRSIQSVAVHLIGLYLSLEYDLPAAYVTRMVGQAAAQSRHFVWLDPPASPGTLTIRDVRKAGTLEEHSVLVEQWARSVWTAWSPHHPSVRDWAARLRNA